MLKAPIGDFKFVEDAVFAQVEADKPFMDLVTDLSNAKVSFTLLHS